MNSGSESYLKNEWQVYPLLQVLLETMDFLSIRLIIDLLSIVHKEIPNRYQWITNIINYQRELTNLSLYSISDVTSIINLFESCKRLREMFIPELSTTEQIYAYNSKCMPHEKVNINYITPFTNTCVVCGRQLVSPKTRPIVYFKQSGVESAILLEYRCQTNECNITYCGIYYRYSTTDRITITPTSIQHGDIIYLGGDAAYEKSLLFEFTSALLFNHVPFYGYANAYNYRNTLKNINSSTLKQLQYKHFQGVWIQYQLASMFFMTSKNLNFECLANFVSMPENRNRYLLEQNKTMEPAFMILWTNHKQIAKEQHVFKYDKKLKQKIDKCSMCMVADGHEKPSRLICGHKASISIRHPELGPVEIGCAETPLRRTCVNVKDGLYCRKHQPDIPNNIQATDGIASNISDHNKTWNSTNEPSMDKLMVNVTKTNEIVDTKIQHHKSIDVDHKIKSLLGLDDQVDVTTDVCNVYRDGLLEQKNDSCGFTAIFYDCGIIVAFQESIRSESVRRLLFLLLTLIKTVNNKVPNALLYDNACSVRLFINKWYNKECFKATDYTTFIKDMHIAIDRFHQDNHRRSICKTIMRADDPSHKGRFLHVNSEICEQMFSYFVRFKSAFRNYGYPKSFTFYMLLFHLKNCQTIGLHPCTQSVQINELYDYWENNSHLTKRRLENKHLISTTAP